MNPGLATKKIRVIAFEDVRLSYYMLKVVTRIFSCWLFFFFGKGKFLPALRRGQTTRTLHLKTLKLYYNP